MTAVRPPIFPPSQASAAPQRADAAKLAAQKAFFDMAMGKAAAPAAAAPTPVQALLQAQVQRIPDPGAEPPAKILRPGSLLDIRV